MGWYAAHILSYIKFIDTKQDKYPVWEHVLLLEADTIETAWSSAETLGQQEYNDVTEFTWEDRPANRVFAGIRKLVTCQDTSTNAIMRGDADFYPGNNTEITYSEFELADEQDLLKLVAGEPVTVRYEE